MAEGKTLGERMVSVEGWIDGHEDLCAERYKNIHEAIGALKDGQRSATRAVWGAALALLAWLALQVWEGRNPPVQTVTVTPPAVVAHPPARP